MDTLTELLRRSVSSHSARTALEMKMGFRVERWTYDDLGIYAGRVAAYLRSLGVEKGDRVVICAPNQPRWVGALFGCFEAGAAVVPLDVQSSHDFASRVMAATGPRIVFGSRSTAPMFEGHESEFVPLEELDRILPGPGPMGMSPACPDDTAEIVFTSGTTGDPKGVVLTHRNIVSNALAARHVVPSGPKSRLLSLLPLSHMFEQGAGLFILLMAGGRIVYPPGRQSGVIARALREGEITAMVAVPQILTLLMSGIEREVKHLGMERRWERAHAIARRLPMPVRRVLFRRAHERLGGRLDFIACGGSYLDPTLAQRWENLGVRVVQGYGATEASPFISCNTYWDRKMDCLGVPLPGQEVRIDADGQIQTRGPNVFAGYWRDLRSTKEAMDRGWYETGDLGSLDERGRLHFRGRKKNMIVLADGRNVFPEDIEPVLSREIGAETAEQAIVVGRSRNGASTEVHAVFLTRDEQEAEGAVIRTNEQLAEFQRIRGFSLWLEDDFPRTRTLRVQRHLVTDYVAGSIDEAPVSAPAPSAPEVGEVRRILAEVCAVSIGAVRGESRVGEDLGLDSLGRVEFLSALEADLGVNIDEQDIKSETTVDQIEEMVGSQADKALSVDVSRWPLSMPIGAFRGAIQRLGVFPSLWALTRPQVTGRENLNGLPGPVLLAANHESHLDSVAALYSIPSALRRRTAVAAAQDYFFASRPVAALASLLINAFPFARTGSIRPSLEYCGKLLDRGWSVLIYPEGTRSVTGEIGEFKAGTGLLSVELGAPVVPIRLVGLDRVLPKGRVLPRPARIQVRIGKPLSFTRDTSYDDATRAIEDAVRAL